MQTRLGLAVLVVVLGGAAGTASARPVAVPQSLVGCWSRHVPALPVGTPAGVWLVRIKSNGAFAAYTPGSTTCDSHWDFTSHVTVAAGRLTIGQVPICSSKGVYTLALKAKSFTLRARSDKACATRIGLLGGTWTRKS